MQVYLYEKKNRNNKENNRKTKETIRKTNVNTRKIDKHKKRQDSVGLQARMVIRHLDTFRAKGALHDGIRIQKGIGIIKGEISSLDNPRIGWEKVKFDEKIFKNYLGEHERN